MTLAEDTERLAEVLSAAQHLAWFPWANLGGRTMSVYRDRREAHDRLLVAVRDMPRRYTDVLPRDLVQAIMRAANCSYVNRRGHHYTERREAIRQLRGALDAHRVWMP